MADVTIFIDTDKDGVLDAGERSTVTDANGNYTFFGVPVGTYQIDEVVPAGSTQTTGAFETATITSVGQVVTVDPIGNQFPRPDLDITKTVTAVDVAGNSVADAAGDIITYRIELENTGNVTLTGLNLKDKVEAYSENQLNIVPGSFSGDTDGDLQLDVDETWSFSVNYTVTQDDLNNKGGGDGDIDNIATARSTQTPDPQSDDAVVQLAYNPDLSIVKDADAKSHSVGSRPARIINYTIRSTTPATST